MKSATVLLQYAEDHTRTGYLTACSNDIDQRNLVDFPDVPWADSISATTDSVSVVAFWAQATGADVVPGSISHDREYITFDIVIDD